MRGRRVSRPPSPPPAPPLIDCGTESGESGEWWLRPSPSVPKQTSVRGGYPRAMPGSTLAQGAHRLGAASIVLLSLPCPAPQECRSEHIWTGSAGRLSPGWELSCPTQVSPASPAVEKGRSVSRKPPRLCPHPHVSYPDAGRAQWGLHGAIGPPREWIGRPGTIQRYGRVHGASRGGDCLRWTNVSLLLR